MRGRDSVPGSTTTATRCGRCGRSARPPTAGWPPAGIATNCAAGARLAGALELVDRRPELLTANERAYVDASQAEHEATDGSTTKHCASPATVLLTVTALGLVLSLFAGGIAVVQRSRAQTQRARANVNEALAAQRAGQAAAEADQAKANEVRANKLRDDAVVRSLVTSSQAAQSTNLPLSLLLAVEANRRSDEAATRARSVLVARVERTAATVLVGVGRICRGSGVARRLACRRWVASTGSSSSEVSTEPCSPRRSVSPTRSARRPAPTCGSRSPTAEPASSSRRATDLSPCGTSPHNGSYPP